MAIPKTYKCKYCGGTIFANTDDFIKVGGNRYAHTDCAAQKASGQAVKKVADVIDDTPLGQLNRYICNLFHLVAPGPIINKEISDFIAQGYTTDGIRNTLHYWYEVKGNPIEKANEHLGIVPFAYNAAAEYQRAVFMNKQRNEAVPIEQIQEEDVVISIPTPTRERPKQSKFTFLLEEN